MEQFIKFKNYVLNLPAGEDKSTIIKVVNNFEDMQMEALDKLNSDLFDNQD